MKNWTKQVPPFQGTEPYLYFAFADEDIGKVWPLMRTMIRRGVRVWYCVGGAGSAAELRARQARAEGAALTLVYLTEAAASDRDTKSMVLVNQKNSRPILVLNPDGADRLLAMGLKESAPVVSLPECGTAEDLEEALIQSGFFTQEMLGEPLSVAEPGRLQRLTAVFSILAVILLGLSFFGVRFLHWFQPAVADTVTFSDPVLQAAARRAAGGGSLTEESLAAVHTLVLTELPETWADLSLMPALEEIVLPQQLLESAPAESGTPLLTEGGYILVLTEGGET